MTQRKLDKPYWVVKKTPAKRGWFKRLKFASPDRQNLLISSIWAAFSIIVSVGIGTYQNSLTEQQINASFQLEDRRFRLESMQEFSHLNAAFLAEANDAIVAVGYLERCASDPNRCNDDRVERLRTALKENSESLRQQAQALAGVRSQASVIWSDLPNSGSDFSAYSFANYIAGISDELFDANVATADDLQKMIQSRPMMQFELNSENAFKELDEYYRSYKDDYTVMRANIKDSL